MHSVTHIIILESTKLRFQPVPGKEVFGHIVSVKILVILNPTGYMLTYLPLLMLSFILSIF